MAAGTLQGSFPTEWKRFAGQCPKCGTDVRWKALYSEDHGAVPPGTPICAQCSEAEPETGSSHQADGIASRLEAVGVHPSASALHMTLDRWDDTQDPHVGEARRFVAHVDSSDPSGAGLYLHGSTGNGKTMLGVAVIRELLDRGVKPGHMLFRLSRAFLRDLGEAYKRGGADLLVRRAKGVRLLVLDEFGKEPPTSHSADLLSEIIDQRQGGTIITSNHSLPEIAARYSHVDGMEHLVSRLGPRRWKHLAFTGPDRRFQA